MRRHPLSTIVKLQKLHEDVALPSESEYRIELRAYLPEGKLGIPPKEWRNVGTGIKAQFEEGYSGELVSAASSNGMFVLGCQMEPEIRAAIYNGSDKTYILKTGDCLAQLRVVADARIACIFEQSEESNT